MIYPKEDPEVWAKRYGIPLTPIPCDCCGKLLPYTIPFAAEDWRGLISDPNAHSCGKKFDHTIVVSVNKERRESLIEAFKILQEELIDE